MVSLSILCLTFFKSIWKKLLLKHLQVCTSILVMPGSFVQGELKNLMKFIAEIAIKIFLIHDRNFYLNTL